MLETSDQNGSALYDKNRTLLILKATFMHQPKKKFVKIEIKETINFKF